MANSKQLQILKQGVEVWNAWRGQHKFTRPDLTETNLTKADLSGVNLSWVNLRGADLRGANLSRADLNRVNLRGAYLSETDLRGADLNRADLNRADLTWANLSGTDFNGANLSGAILHGAILHGAILRGADLTQANLTEADLSGANLSQVRLLETVFGNTTLTAVQGIETCQHVGPSTLDHRTIARSWPLPLAFLRGCGLPDTLINYLPSLPSMSPCSSTPASSAMRARTTPLPNACTRISRIKGSGAGLLRKI